MEKIERLLDEALSPAKQKALNFIYKKNKAQREKEFADQQYQEVMRAKRESDQKLAQAKKTYSHYENAEKIILQLAGIPSVADDRPNRAHAIETLFDVLNLLGNGKVGTLPFSALYNQIRPVTLLFDYVRESAFYDEKNKNICIDGRLLYKRVMARIAEQKRLKAQASAVFAEMEKEMKS